MRAISASGVVAASLLAVAARPVTSQTSMVGRPSAGALASAQTKQTVMREPEGPESVVLNPDEVASLIEAGLDAGARRSLDSIQVRLQAGRIGFDAYVVTASWNRGPLAPVAMVLGARERLKVAGPARAVKAGVVRWRPDTVVIRTYAVPSEAIPRLVDQLTGGSDGTVPIAVPPTVRQIMIWPFGVAFSRRAG